MAVSAVKIMVFWLILCVFLVSGGLVDTTPEILDNYVTIETINNSTVTNIKSDYLLNMSGVIEANESANPIISGSEMSFTNILAKINSALGGIPYFFVAPVILTRQLGMPWEMQVIIGVIFVVMLVWAVVGLIRGHDA